MKMSENSIHFGSQMSERNLRMNQNNEYNEQEIQKPVINSYRGQLNKVPVYTWLSQRYQDSTQSHYLYSPQESEKNTQIKQIFENLRTNDKGELDLINLYRTMQKFYHNVVFRDLLDFFCLAKSSKRGVLSFREFHYYLSNDIAHEKYKIFIKKIKEDNLNNNNLYFPQNFESLVNHLNYLISRDGLIQSIDKQLKPSENLQQLQKVFLIKTDECKSELIQQSIDLMKKKIQIQKIENIYDNIPMMLLHTNNVDNNWTPSFHNLNNLDEHAEIPNANLNLASDFLKNQTQENDELDEDIILMGNIQTKNRIYIDNKFQNSASNNKNIKEQTNYYSPKKYKTNCSINKFYTNGEEGSQIVSNIILDQEMNKEQNSSNDLKLKQSQSQELEYLIEKAKEKSKLDQNDIYQIQEKTQIQIQQLQSLSPQSPQISLQNLEERSPKTFPAADEKFGNLNHHGQYYFSIFNNKAKKNQQNSSLSNKMYSLGQLTSHRLDQKTTINNNYTINSPNLITDYSQYSNKKHKLIQKQTDRETQLHMLQILNYIDESSIIKCKLKSDQKQFSQKLPQNLVSKYEPSDSQNYIFPANFQKLEELQNNIFQNMNIDQNNNLSNKQQIQNQIDLDL